MTADFDDFFEEDQPVEDVLAAFHAGLPVDFAPPHAAARNLASDQGWIRVNLVGPILSAPLFRADLKPNPAYSRT